MDEIRARTYDAVVLDMTMRDGRGEDILRLLVQRRPNAKFVVIISARSPAAIEDAASANVHAKLRKPFDIGQLVRAVRACTRG